MTPRKWILRDARQDDLAFLPAIERAAETVFPPERLTPSTSLLSHSQLTQALADDCLWVATANDVVIGFCAAERINEDLHILEVDVLPPWQRNGIGRALLNRAIESGREKACRRITLTTFADLAWNGPFYKSLGFSEITPGAREVRLSAQLAKEKAMGYTQRVAMAFLL